MKKLPVCPGCGAKYSYGEIWDIKKGMHICDSCEKKFIVNKKRGTLLLLISCILMILINLIVIFSSGELEITGLVILTAIDAAVITAAALLRPLTVRFIPVKMTKAEKRQLRKENAGRKHNRANNGGKNK